MPETSCKAYISAAICCCTSPNWSIRSSSWCNASCTSSLSGVRAAGAVDDDAPRSVSRSRAAADDGLLFRILGAQAATCSSRRARRSESVCWHSQMSCCTKTEWMLFLDPHSRKHASKNSWKFVGPSWCKSMMVCSVCFGMFGLMPTAWKMSCVRGSESSSRTSARVTVPELSRSALSNNVCKVLRNWSDSATNDSMALSCSTE
mmetsp:Transcript_101312/g.285693  ORF Transcript_101312/g.285693 Transcript_101312/m.285693 type:complete len:204 (+) Transcript_101312:475-1086(+)